MPPNKPITGLLTTPGQKVQHLRGMWIHNHLTSAYKPSANYQYNPTSPRTDRRLVLAEIQETKAEQAKYKLTNEINPGKFGLEIRGGLYTTPYKAGLWMYFARPEPSSLAAALQHPAIASKREQTVLAQSVQDEVVGPLF